MTRTKKAGFIPARSVPSAYCLVSSTLLPPWRAIALAKAAVFRSLSFYPMLYALYCFHT